MIRGHYFRTNSDLFQRICNSRQAQDKFILWTHKGGRLQAEDFLKGYEDYFNIDCWWQAIGFLLTVSRVGWVQRSETQQTWAFRDSHVGFCFAPPNLRQNEDFRGFVSQ